MADRPFLSFFTPIYNGKEYLNEYLESFKNQTCQNFEVVFWDDCSTDDSRDIITDFIKNNSTWDGQYRLYKSERNMGSGHFYLPKIVDYLNGEYTFSFSQDDFIDVNFVELCYQKSQEKDYDIILTNTALYKNDQTILLGREYLSEFSNGRLTNRDLFNLSLTWKVSSNGCRKISLLKKEGYFADTYYNIDELVLRKSLLMTDRIAYVDTNYYYRVDNKNALTKKVKPFTFDILITDTMLTDFMIEKDFKQADIEKQIRKLVDENNWYIFQFFENMHNYSVEPQLQIKEKLIKAREKIVSYSETYKVDISNLYDLEQVEKGVCYKKKGLKPFWEILTYRKGADRLRAVKIFGIQIAKWMIKKK